jgi:hypothetical protein
LSSANEDLIRATAEGLVDGHVAATAAVAAAHAASSCHNATAASAAAAAAAAAESHLHLVGFAVAAVSTSDAALAVPLLVACVRRITRCSDAAAAAAVAPARYYPPLIRHAFSTLVSRVA